jgi:hypothetical protein
MVRIRTLPPRCHPLQHPEELLRNPEAAQAFLEMLGRQVMTPFGQKIEAVEAIVPGVASSGAVPQSMPSIADNYTRKNRRSLR